MPADAAETPDATATRDAAETPDATPTPGGPPMKREVIVSQTNSTEILAGIACTGPNTLPKEQQTLLENSFYRAFPLSDHGITSGFSIKQISFGVYRATAGTGSSQPVEVTAFAYSGAAGGTTLDLARMTPLGKTTFMLANITAATVIDVPLSVEVPANVDVLVVEVYLRDGQQAKHKFSIGVNRRGERVPAYLRSPNCNHVSPTAVKDVDGYESLSLVLSVTGDA